MNIPQGYYIHIDHYDVRIFRHGHKCEEEEGELLFQSSTLQYRRPTTWTCAYLNDEEAEVLNKILYDGWKWKANL